MAAEVLSGRQRPNPSSKRARLSQTLVHMHFKSAAAVVVLLACCACSPEQSPIGQSHLNGFACNEGPYALRLAKDYRKLRHLPGFVSEKVYEGENRFAPRTRSLLFKGLSIDLVTLSSGAPPLWGTIHISSPDWDIGAPLRVGAKASELAKLVGKGQMADGEWRFHGGGADVLVITLKERKVSDIVYACYTG